MKYLAVLALFVAAAVMAAEDQVAQETKPLRSWGPQLGPSPRGPWQPPTRWGRSVQGEIDDQDTEENHRRPYYGSSHYRPSNNRYGRSVVDAEVQIDDQQTDNSHYRRYGGYGGYGGHYGGYYGGYGHRRPYWG